MWNFCNLLYKGFSVESSTIGKIQFQGAINEYLILARHNIIDIYSFKNSRLDLQKEIELFANLKFIKKIPSPSNSQSDLFFCLADDLSYAFCSFDDGELCVKGEGEINIPSSYRVETDSIKVIADIDQQSYVPNFSFSGTKYIAVYAYKEIINIFPFRYLDNGDINLEKPFILRLSSETLIDIIPLDPKLNKSQKHLLGVISSDKDISTFQALEFNVSTEELSKKPLWDIQNIKDPYIYKMEELSEGGILLFAETYIQYNLHFYLST